MIHRDLLRRAAAVALLTLVAGACSSGDGDDAASDTTTADATTTTGTESDDAARTRHVALMAFDGLDAARVAGPEGDMLTLLAGAGHSATVPATPECRDTWSGMLASDDPATGALDVALDAGAEVGVFTTSNDVADELRPDGDATVEVGDAGVPGLEPWATAKLALETTRDAAIRHASEAASDSVTVLQSDIIAIGAADPDAAELAPIATATADDLVDVMVSAIDARPSRPGEDWLFVVVGCDPGGTTTVIVEGDGVDTAEPLNPDDDGVEFVGALIGDHLATDGGDR